MWSGAPLSNSPDCITSHTHTHTHTHYLLGWSSTCLTLPNIEDGSIHPRGIGMRPVCLNCLKTLVKDVAIWSNINQLRENQLQIPFFIFIPMQPYTILSSYYELHHGEILNKYINSYLTVYIGEDNYLKKKKKSVETKDLAVSTICAGSLGHQGLQHGFQVVGLIWTVKVLIQTTVVICMITS